MTDPDFIEFSFSDHETAERAAKIVTAPWMHMGASLALPADDLAFHGDAVRDALRAAGFAWSEIPSDITEADMWPEWPGNVAEEPSAELAVS